MSPAAPTSPHRIAVVGGDGIGPEVIAEARALVEVVGAATGAGFALEEIPCGGKFYLTHGSRDTGPIKRSRGHAASSMSFWKTTFSARAPKP